MYTKEQKILRFSMMLLFLALMIVYIVWYQVKGNELKSTLQSEETTGSNVQIIDMSGYDDIREDDVLSTGSSTGMAMVVTGKTTITTGTKTNTGIVPPTTGTMKKNDAITMLSGTSIYYGKIDIIEKLGIKYQYALTDSSGIWYMYLGTPSYDFASIARALKGNIYTMATEQEIIANKLFGNKVVFINLPEYKDQKVVMLIYMNDGIRLLQVDYSIYHKSKAHIKSLFID